MLYLHVLYRLFSRFVLYFLLKKYSNVCCIVIKLCKNENTRKLYTIAYNSRNPENVVLLEQAIKLRKQAAKLLGFKNHAAFNLDIKMAKTVEAVDIVSTLIHYIKKRVFKLYNVVFE